MQFSLQLWLEYFSLKLNVNIQSPINLFLSLPDNSVHWTRPQKPKAPMKHFYQVQAPSAEVEMTSYVLLAHLTAQPAPTSKELTSALSIVKWITKQQNSQGGFSSTQVCGLPEPFASLSGIKRFEQEHIQE